MYDVLDLMEAELDARQQVREIVDEFMREFTAPLAEVAQIKSMLAAGQPHPGVTEQQLRLARRAAGMARGQQEGMPNVQ